MEGIVDDALRRGDYETLGLLPHLPLKQFLLNQAPAPAPAPAPSLPMAPSQEPYFFYCLFLFNRAPVGSEG